MYKQLSIMVIACVIAASGTARAGNTRAFWTQASSANLTTAINVANYDTSTITVTLVFYSMHGTELGSPLTNTIAPNGRLNLNTSNTGNSTLDTALAGSSSGSVWIGSSSTTQDFGAYATVYKTTAISGFNFTIPTGSGDTYANSSSSSTTTNSSCSGSSCTTISGKVEYVDRTFDSTGFTGTANMPVRYAQVEVMVDGTAAATGATDSSGNYSISLSYTSGTVYVRALTDSDANYAATIMDDRDSSIYAVSSSTLSVTSGGTTTSNLLADTTGAGPAFNIFDNLIKAQIALKTLSSKTLAALTIYWYDGTTNGTYYTTSNGEHVIYLLGQASDSDSYDDSVILHEIGHYVAQVYSKDSSPGGQHSLTGHYDIRLTWSEGWASFYQSMTQDISGISNPQYYVDNVDADTLSFAVEIESPSYSTSATGADNEVSVSSMLWDIYDDANESWDTLAMGYDELWNIMENVMTTKSVASFETFWDSWEANQQAGQLADIIGNRGVQYSADSYEDDDTVATARSLSAGISESHTVFPALDKDYFAISVTSGTRYVFTTSDLGDGADTALTLYDSDGTTQLDYGDDTVSSKASRIIWTADATKTVYLLCEDYQPVSSGDPDAVVQYGYYTISFTSN